MPRAPARARLGRGGSVRRRAIGAARAPASVTRQQRRADCSYPCNSGAPAVLSRTRGALLLSCTQRASPNQVSDARPGRDAVVCPRASSRPLSGCERAWRREVAAPAKSTLRNRRSELRILSGALLGTPCKAPGFLALGLARRLAPAGLRAPHVPNSAARWPEVRATGQSRRRGHLGQPTSNVERALTAHGGAVRIVRRQGREVGHGEERSPGDDGGHGSAMSYDPPPSSTRRRFSW